jgi:hypothetical protein
LNRITISHPEAHEKLTARLFWKLTSEKGYVDAGKVRDYVDATTRSLVTRSRSEQGARHVNNEQADINHESYTFLLDERVPEQERLIKLARDLDDQQQNATESATATIESIALDRWFDIGAWNIANVLVAGAVSGVLEEGADYDIDQQNGRIRAITGGAAANGETLHLTFDQPGIILEKRETQKQPLFYCDLIIEELNQYSKMWLRRSVFKGYVNATEFPTQSGEFGTYRIKATPAGPVVVSKRPEAQTLPSHAEAGAPGDASSSSSSSSTHSSSSSSTVSYSSSSGSSASSNSSSSTAASGTSASSNSSSSSSSVSSPGELLSSASSASTNSSSSSSSAQSVSSSSSSSSRSSNSSSSSKHLTTSSSSISSKSSTSSEGSN